jgi:hypothetical protein
MVNTRKFITKFTRARKLEPNVSNLHSHFALGHLCTGLSSCIFNSHLRVYVLKEQVISLMHSTCPCLLDWFSSNNIWRQADIKFVIMRFFYVLSHIGPSIRLSTLFLSTLNTAFDLHMWETMYHTKHLVKLQIVYINFYMWMWNGKKKILNWMISSTPGIYCHILWGFFLSISIIKRVVLIQGYLSK